MAALTPDALAACVYRLYDTLPPHAKPQIRANGKPEWTVLSAIVLVKQDEEPLVASLAAGVRCLPKKSLSPHGDRVHDSHAEVLARRGFLVWLMEELARLRSGSSRWIEPTGSNSDRARIKESVDAWFYISTLPCGDASIAALEHSRVSTADDHATKFTAPYLSSIASTLADHRPADDAEISTADPASLSRGHLGFSHRGALRTKPGRLDSPPSTSHSCSDKLAQWNVVGLQGSLLSAFFEDVLPSTYVIALSADATPQELGAAGVAAEVRRALIDRVAHLRPCSSPPRIACCDPQFAYSREAVALRHPGAEIVTSVTCTSYIAGLGTEVLDPRGQKQGASTKKLLPNGALPAKARSRLSKIELFARFKAVTGSATGSDTYYDTKHLVAGSSPRAYRHRKDELREPTGPFGRWLVHGRPFESFTSDGGLVDAMQ